jgi:hypothetical protein
MKKKILYILIFLVVSVISLSLPIFILKSIQKDLKEILNTRNKIKENLSLFEEILKYKKIMKENQREMEEIKENILNLNFPLPFVQFLEEKAKELNVKIEEEPNLSQIQKLKEKEFGFLSFSISVSGEKEKLLLFLKKIENEKFLVEIEKVTISGENLSKMSISGKVFGK